MVKTLSEKITGLEKISYKITDWIGTPQSAIIHTFLFIGIFSLYFFGFATQDILLILTTAVSLEAIYLAIFIQMTVNRNTESLEEVEEDLEAFGEDIEDIQEDVNDEEEAHKILLNIGTELKHIQQDLNTLKKKGLL